MPITKKTTRAQGKQRKLMLSQQWQPTSSPGDTSAPEIISMPASSGERDIASPVSSSQLEGDGENQEEIHLLKPVTQYGKDRRATISKHQRTHGKGPTRSSSPISMAQTAFHATPPPRPTKLKVSSIMTIPPSRTTKSVMQPNLVIVDANEEDELLESVEAERSICTRGESIELGDSSLWQASHATPESQPQEASVLALKFSHARGFLAQIQQPNQETELVQWEDALDINAKEATQVSSLT